MGRAPRTKETLPDFLKWCRVTRPPLVFRGLTGSQRTPGFWGVTVDHILIHCSKAIILWDLLLDIYGVSWVFPLSVKETLLSWQGLFVGKRRKKAWMAAPLCIFRTLWRERNRFVFEGVDISINRMKSTFLSNLYGLGLICIVWRD